ncbi:MAG: MFS transporter [Terracidiphilus sp.]|nr:MFS transporter [Terracidiphilus sp.]MDR3798138.1 MFS transporter [Terracidiphilus sp.]
MQNDQILANHDSHPPAAIPGRRWRIAWLLGIGILVNYFDRVNLSVSHNALIGAFGISDVVFGYLSSAYNWTYAACQLPIGVILDKFGVRRVGRVGTFLWSAASFAAAATPNLGGFFGARFLLGVGEAPAFPANAKAIGLWFPARERSLATALNDAAAKFASAIGVPIIGIVLIHTGWRWSFAFTGAISFAYFIYFSRVYRDPGDDPELTEIERRYIDDRNSSQGAQEHDEEEASSLGQLIAQRKVLGLALGFGAYNYVFYLLLYWLPTYLSSTLHIDLLHSFVYTSVPWFFATATDLAIGGWLVDFLVKRGCNSSTVRRVVLIGGTAFGLGILGAAHAHNATQALVWISVSLGGLAAAAPVAWSLPSLIAARGNVGKVGGIINFCGQISGITASILTGYLVSAFHSYAWAFAVAGAYLAVGIAGYLFLLGKIEAPRPSLSSNQNPFRR